MAETVDQEIVTPDLNRTFQNNTVLNQASDFGFGLPRKDSLFGQTQRNFAATTMQNYKLNQNNSQELMP